MRPSATPAIATSSLLAAVGLIATVVPPAVQAGPSDQLARFSRLPQAEAGCVFEPAIPAEPAADPWGGPVPEWTYALGAPTLGSVRLADVDGDGLQDIVIGTYDPIDPYSAGWVYVFDMFGNLLPNWPVRTAGALPASPAVADLDADGDAEIIVGSWQRAYVWNHDGSNYPGWPIAIGSYNSPAIADLDADGDLEIIYSSTNKRLYVWNHDGTTLPGWPYTAPELIQSPAVADVDGDGRPEIAAGTYQGPVSPDPFEFYVWNDDGTVAPGWPVATSGVVKAIAALGDVDDDDAVEIVACAYHSSNRDYLYVWDAQGNLEPGWPLRVEYARLSSPTLADLDGDQDLEIVIGGANPDPLREKVFAFHHDGSAVAGWPVMLDFPGGHANINSSPIVADIDGDAGRLEIVVKVVNNIFALHGDGSVVTGFPFFLSDDNHSGTISPTPAVGDLDGDRDVEYVFVSCSGNLAFFDEDAAFSPHWAYWPMFKHDRLSTSYLPPECVGDLDGDGDRDLADLAALLANYGMSSGALYEDGDLDRDGDVDLADLAELLAHYNQPCP